MPGIGDLLYQAILKRDVFLAGYIVMKSALFIILINSIVDFIAYIITLLYERDTMHKIYKYIIIMFLLVW